MDKISKLRRARGERAYEISAINRILFKSVPDPRERMILAMRCAAAAKTARRKHFERVLKGKLGEADGK